MAKVALETVGCRLNQYETERLAAELVACGMERVGYNDKADLYILNSCTVTSHADADCRKLISRACRKNEKAVIVVTGCYVEADPIAVAELKGVDLVVGNNQKSNLYNIILKKYPHLVNDKPVGEATSQLITSSGPFGGRSRAMVKIADGCDQSCSYCIVPRVRGQFYSIGVEAIIREVERLISAGYREVVLTAVHIGKYKSDGLNLCGLVKKILAETGLKRLRLSSLEPNELTDELIELIVDHPRVCRHLHLPLQSGSDRILGLMRRPYRRDDYLAVIRKVKNLNSDATIGCDLIIGFPGETEDDFSDSLNILGSGYLDYSHVFSYSDRPDTPASKIPDKVDVHIIRDRSSRAREIIHGRKVAHYESQIGKIFGVIPEQKLRRDGTYNALSDNYIRVKVSLRQSADRQIINFKPLRLADKSPQRICLTGEVIAQQKTAN